MIASFLTEQACKGIKALDPQSPCARQLKNLDAENLIREDIGRICQYASVIEIARIMSLAGQFNAAASMQKKEAIKKELKKIAQKLTARAERRCGGLKVPRSCRDLLFNL
jgi:hypothetical protein